MTTPNLFTRIKATVSGTPGTGLLTFGAAVAGFLAPSDIGIPDGTTVSYTIEDGTNFECGYGIYNATAGTLSRIFPITSSSVSGTTPILITATSAAIVFLSAFPQDIVRPDAAIVVAAGSWFANDYTNFYAQAKLTNIASFTRIGQGTFKILFVNPVPLSAVAAAVATCQTPNGNATMWVQFRWGVGDDWNMIQGVTLSTTRWDSNVVDPSMVRFIMTDRADNIPPVITPAQTYTHYRFEMTYKASGGGPTFVICEMGLKDVAGTTQTPIAVTADTTASGSNISNIFDGSTATQWVSGGSNAPNNIYMQFATAFQLNGITLTAGINFGNHNDCPVLFNLYGSNDGTNWTALSHTYSFPVWSSELQVQSITLSKATPPKLPALNDTTTAYSCYRFKMTANSDTGAGANAFYEVLQMMAFDQDGIGRPGFSAQANSNTSTSFCPTWACIGSPQNNLNGWHSDASIFPATFDIFYSGAFVFNALQLQAGYEYADCPVTIEVLGSHDGLAFTHVGNLTFPPFTSYEMTQIANIFGGTSPNGTSAAPNAPPAAATKSYPTQGTGTYVGGIALGIFPVAANH